MSFDSNAMGFYPRGKILFAVVLREFFRLLSLRSVFFLVSSKVKKKAAIKKFLSLRSPRRQKGFTITVAADTKAFKHLHSSIQYLNIRPY